MNKNILNKRDHIVNAKALWSKAHDSNILEYPELWTKTPIKFFFLYDLTN